MVKAKTTKSTPKAKTTKSTPKAIATAVKKTGATAGKKSGAEVAVKKTVKKSPGNRSGSKRASTKTAAAKTAAKSPAKKSASKKLPFSKGEYVVYPTHGVGRVTGIEKREVAGFNLQLFVILFDSEKMTLRVPVDKVSGSGLRKISSKDKMQAVTATLKGRARSKRTMWSRRAQEYEAKINSGDPVAIAEVVRDLYRAEGQPEQSYSERQMYEAALDRLVNEYALVEKLDLEGAIEKIEKTLAG